MRTNRKGRGKEYEAEAEKLIAKIDANTEGRFDQDKQIFIDSVEFYSDDAVEKILDISDTLKNAKHFGRMLAHLTSDAKGDAGKEIAKQIIRHHLQDDKREDILDRCLMIAAKMGDTALYEEVYNAGGRFARNKELCVDENNFNVLHYACQSENAELVHDIAETMRLAEDNYENAASAKASDKNALMLRPPEDSKVNDKFDPFRIRDDKSGTKSYTQINELRPIHYMSYSLARALDEQYGLPDDGSPGTFVSAYSLFRIENRVLAKTNTDWAKQKTHSYGHEVQDTALKGKVFAGIGVANLDKINLAANPSEAIIASNIAAAGLIAATALVFAGYQGIQHKRHKNLAINAMSAYEFVSLPDFKTGKITRPEGSYIDKKRFQFRDVLRGSNHDMMEALKIHDYRKIMQLAQDPEGFKTTTLEMIQAVRQLNLNPATNPALAKTRFFKEKIYQAMVDKMNYQSTDAATTLNALFDSLYRTETNRDNDLAQQLIARIKLKNISYTDIQQTIAKWSTDLIIQEILLSDDKHFKKEKPATPPGNDNLIDGIPFEKEKPATAPGKDNLIDALENYDYYKVRHILAHGKFNYTSKEIMHTIESRFVIPTDLANKTDLKGDAREKPFLEFLFESLAKKAGPKQFMAVLSHLINTRGQVETGKKILATLIERYDRDNADRLNADRERLIVCALLAAGLGEKESLQHALDALQNRHFLSTLEIMDENGNNILHYAAKSQDSDMIKYIMQNTSLIHDFNMTNKKVIAKPAEGLFTEIKDWGKYKLASENERMISERKFHDTPEERETLTSIKKAESIFEIPNRDGITPFRLLSNKETVARLDEFVGGTVGFRQDANEHRQNERNRKEDRAATVAQASIIIAMLAASCGAIIPGAIGIGTALGTLIATKVGLASFLPGFTIMGGVTEGTTALGLTLGIEHGLMPTFGKLGTALYRQWDKAFNGTSMESLTDYDDRILTKSDQITTRIANSLIESGPTKYADVMDLIAQETNAFIDAESDPTMKKLARLAAVNAAMRFTPSEDVVDPNNLDALALATRSMVFEAARTIENKVNISNARIIFYDTFNELKEEIAALKNERAVIHKAQKINQKIDRLYDALERITQDYASTSDVRAVQIENPDMNMDEAFREAAIQKAHVDLNRQIAVIDSSSLSEDDKLAEKNLATAAHDEKFDFIEEIYSALDEAYNLRADNYERAYKNTGAKKMIFEEFRERLAEIEGGTLQRGPLTQAADKIFKNPKDYPHPDNMAAALDAAYHHIRHPQPEKAIQMRRALNLFIDRQHYLEDAKKIDLTQSLMKEADTASNLNQIKSLNTHLEKHTLAQSNLADHDPQIRKELKAEWDKKFQPLLDQITLRREKLLDVAMQLESAKGANRDDTNKIEKKLLQLAAALKDCNNVISNLDRIGDNIHSNRLQGQQVALTADIIIPINRRDPQFQNDGDFRQALEEARKPYVGKVSSPQAPLRLGPLNAIPVDLSSQGAIMVIHQKSPAKTNANPVDTVATLEKNPSSQELAITVNQIDKLIRPQELVETAIMLIETYVNQNPKKPIPISGSNVALTNAMKTYCDAMKNLMKDPKEKLRYTREPDTDLTRAEKQAHERAVSNMETYIKKTPQNMEKVNARNAQANSKPGFFSRSKQDNVEKFITKIRPGNR